MQKLKNLLFLDIETASGTDDFTTLDERVQKQWQRKANFLRNEQELTADELYFDRAAIYAEFGKVIVISIGYFVQHEDKLTLRLKALYNDNEEELLREFNNIITRFDAENLRLCAHNGREFDFPYLSRRLLINGLPLPSALDLSGKKPWEINHLDTMDLWKFGDYKHFTSLELLASIFGIESSKTNLDGSQVNATYYLEKDLPKIARYCMDDVRVTAELYAKIKQIDLGEFQVVEVD